ncbi:hypothetical protein M0811_11433 [Anaeramoeba ignava]|uniref:Uncharacterized protein n=1 Tax=Anaeramoeba ignava TaxID=1746090 RepID=A0A9Q0LBB2_ANAIG|nr:hypothetical protein M0811_11433 [Anaeramoeba ignava]
MARSKPNIFWIIGAQIVSVVGDAFGQRCSRVDHKSSRKHMMISFPIISSLQIFLILLILEYSLPQSIVGAIYRDSNKIQCYKEIDIEGKDIHCTDQTCTKIKCPRGGPIEMFRSLKHYPMLFLNGVQNWFYYSAEVILYREPLGLLFLVLASLASSFLIEPVNKIFGSPASTQNIPGYLIFLGIFGSIICIVEKKISNKKKNSNQLKEDESKFLLENEFDDEKNSNSEKESILKKLFLPFAILSFTYSVWFVSQTYFNNNCRINAFTYTSVDQVLLPFYLYPFMFLMDYVSPFKKCFYDGSDKIETLIGALLPTWKESSIFNLFVYRLLINGRAFIYYYLAILYDINLVYLQLTLIRIVFSWVGSLILCLLVPKFIATTKAEKDQTFSLFNIILKITGSIIVVVSLILLNEKS